LAPPPTTSAAGLVRIQPGSVANWMQKLLRKEYP